MMSITRQTYADIRAAIEALKQAHATWVDVALQDPPDAARLRAAQATIHATTATLSRYYDQLHAFARLTGTLPPFGHDDCAAEWPTQAEVGDMVRELDFHLCTRIDEAYGLYIEAFECKFDGPSHEAYLRWWLTNAQNGIAHVLADRHRRAMKVTGSYAAAISEHRAWPELRYWHERRLRVEQGKSS